MTIYGRYNAETRALEVKSDGAYSNGEWETLSYHATIREARAEFFRYKNGYYRPAWTSNVKWVG